jgi:hypothetical protein
MDDNEYEEGYEEPTESERELVDFVIEHTNRWRDYRDTNFLADWDEYERIFRGRWSALDKTKETERSRLVSPATQQAIETRHAEVMEAIFGQGEFFDIKDDIMDVNGNPLDVEEIKAKLNEDFKQDKIIKAIDAVELMAEIYGTGIGEILVKEVTAFRPATKPIPGVAGTAAIGVEEYTRISVPLKPVNPRNFLIDPNADSIEDALGVAIEKYVSIHKVVQNMENGTYKKVDIGSDYGTQELEPTQDETQYQDDKVKLLTYYGLVPREYLEEGEEKEYEELFPEGSEADEYCNLVEAIVVIANDGILLKAEASPYMMKDRPVVAYQDDTVPGRFWGRGTAEKAYNMQKAIDSQYRSMLDSMALTTAPMVAMDATRLPRGAKFEVRPGKAILTNGAPSEILMPFNFGRTDGTNAAAAQNFERMLLQATGTVDASGMPTQAPRDAGASGMSMVLAGIIKKYKRTLSNFQEDFLIPFIKKAAFRYMQFDPERYPSVDMNFIPTGNLGIMAREYEQQQLIGLLQTLGPDTPVLPIILKGILANSSLSNRGELMTALDQMSQPNPEAQQAAMQAQQMDMALKQAQTQELSAKATKEQAEAQKTMIEAQLLPEKHRVDIIQAAATNLDNGGDFEKRLKLADVMLKEKQVNLKAADIASNERIATLQMMNRAKKA